MSKNVFLICLTTLIYLILTTSVRGEMSKAATIISAKTDSADIGSTQVGSTAPKKHVQVKGQKLFFRGKPFYVKGISYLPHRSFEGLKPAQIRAKATSDLAAIRDMGLNTIIVWPRTPATVLDVAEEYQLKVIEQVVHIGSETDFESNKVVSAILEEVKSVVERDKNRPNIIMWRAWNDAPFEWGKGGEPLRDYGLPKMQAILEKVTSTIRAIDPYRPVLGSNILNSDFWYIGLQNVDVIGFNYYLGITDWFEGKFSPLAATAAAKKLENISSIYRKPVVLTETGYSTFCKAVSQADAIKAQLHALAKTKTAGFCLFEWTDQWWKAGSPRTLDSNIEEHWGLTTANGSFKSGYTGIREVIISMPNLKDSISQVSEKSYGLSDISILQDDLSKNGQPVETTTFKLSTGDCTAEVKKKNETIYSTILEIIPISTGAWVELECQWPNSQDLLGSWAIGFKASQDGPTLNVSLLLTDEDGDRWKSPSWSPGPDAKWRWYRFTDFYRDPHSHQNSGNDSFDLSRVSAHTLRVTFVPGFEKVGERRLLTMSQPFIIPTELSKTNP